MHAASVVAAGMRSGLRECAKWEKHVLNIATMIPLDTSHGCVPHTLEGLNTQTGNHSNRKDLKMLNM